MGWQLINTLIKTELVADETLMLQYAQGDFAAFEQLYQRHKGGLYRYFLRQVGEHGLAEDLFQDIWAKVISQAPNYHVKAKFSTWLYTLAQHKLIDHVRHIKVVNKVIDAAPFDADDIEIKHDIHGPNTLTPDIQLENKGAAGALKHCIHALPLVQRECFLLKEEAGLTVEVIATIVGANYQACKSRLRYAYSSLRQCISHKLGQTSV
ncbi:MAG: sigma-70 family RNA polymerase sigma factor [Paraglaciecola sp.]|uniref:sigma-70 family RNA polymerase sigma factor n=1 Tax=Paraglaciecola sp. TaxID=1920173 RepID=UPI00273E07E3|nr:sigma-70 family RNA polymerase sigma factor [Paraglaciecola sp.]MDP5032114.1 sigma-70 family RNA polymerase sigma factor [Paraglaciecola sp.]MDP5040885.1 sigma-70 family RNA polymerase sigma factor [Paraglaciecola sp.]MDP5131810.1 sigma-70 family RNA polymerase sigma factor [Paraglaciecola sp.]